MTEIFHDIPTYDNGKWTITNFDTRESFAEFVKSTFKEPGKYEFDETAKLFNERIKVIARPENKFTFCVLGPDKTALIPISFITRPKPSAIFHKLIALPLLTANKFLTSPDISFINCDCLINSE